MPEIIALTPTWSELLPALLAILEDPDISEDAKKPCREELMRLATWADKVNTKIKKEN